MITYRLRQGLNVQSGGSTSVEELSEGSSGKDPGVTAGVVVALITTIKDTRNVVLVVHLVNGIFVAEELIVNLDSAWIIVSVDTRT